MTDITAKLAEALRGLLAKNERFSGGTWDAAREALRLYEQAKPAEPLTEREKWNAEVEAKKVAKKVRRASK